MAVITMASAHGAPGVTTTVTALASMWPGPVLVVDADPHGGAVIPGWLGRSWAEHRLDAEKNVVSFASATRHVASVPAEELASHAQHVPGMPHVWVLGGLTRRAQTEAVGRRGWQRLASAVRDLTRTSLPDVLIDAGRWQEATPWPLFAEADLVLVGLRPHLRYLSPASEFVAAVRDHVPAHRIEAAVSATNRRDAVNVAGAGSTRED